MAFWRRDGKELYYLGADRGVRAVEVGAATTTKFGRPTLLFRPSDATPVAPGTASISRDGERIVIAVPAAATPAADGVRPRRGRS